MDAYDLYQLIAKMHAPPEWACFSEVRSSTRTADAIAMCLWPSRGFTIRGFEIKVRRSDWKREAADPTKAETIAAYCDEWWIVTPPGLIQDPSEVPPAWGLMEPGKKGGLRTQKRAQKTEATPLRRGFVASLLRAANRRVEKIEENWIPRRNIRKEIDKAREEGRKLVPRDMQYMKAEKEALEKSVDEFEKVSGIPIRSKHFQGHVSKHAAEAYKLGIALLGRYSNGLPLIVRTLRGSHKRLSDVIEQLETLVEEEKK